MACPLQEVEDLVYEHELQPWFQQQGYLGFYLVRQRERDMRVRQCQRNLHCQSTAVAGPT